MGYLWPVVERKAVYVCWGEQLRAQSGELKPCWKKEHRAEAALRLPTITLTAKHHSMLPHGTHSARHTTRPQSARLGPRQPLGCCPCPGFVPHLPCRYAGQLAVLLGTTSQLPWEEQLLRRKRRALRTCACLQARPQGLSCSAYPLSGCTGCHACFSGLLDWAGLPGRDPISYLRSAPCAGHWLRAIL